MKQGIKNSLEELKTRAMNRINDYFPDFEKYRLNSFINGGITKEEYLQNKVDGANAIYVKNDIFYLITQEGTEVKFLKNGVIELEEDDFDYCLNYNVYLIS